MRLRFGALAASGALFWAGCSTVSSRIGEHRAVFDASAPGVQDAIRAGRVEAGFSPEQTYMALGRPDRVIDRKTAADAGETWLYGVGGGGPAAGFGVGMGGPGFGVGMTAADAPESGARLRVEFVNGRVVSIDARR